MAEHPDERIKRDAFLYLDPGETRNEFAQCNTCRDWVEGDAKCCIHGPSVNVPGSASCGLYVNGVPQPAGTTTYADVTPEESGLVDRPVRCENCRWFVTNLFNTGESECNLFSVLNMYHPQIFDLDTAVDAKGCCNANQAKDA